MARETGGAGGGWRRGSREDASLVCGISMKSARGRARVENFGWRVLFGLPRCADNCWRLLTVKVPNAVALPTRLHWRELVKPGDLAGEGGGEIVELDRALVIQISALDNNSQVRYNTAQVVRPSSASIPLRAFLPFLGDDRRLIDQDDFRRGSSTRAFALSARL